MDPRPSRLKGVMVITGTPEAVDTTGTAVVVMGVSGCGKSTVAVLLAEALGWEFADGDEFHPVANVEKMRNGAPLTDEDRRPWLEAIREWVDAAPGDVVVTCSALRRRYRDVLSTARPRVRYVHLDGPDSFIGRRIQQREGHFMPGSLLSSQRATLEALAHDEDGVVVGVESTPDEIVARILVWLGGRPR